MTQQRIPHWVPYRRLYAAISDIIAGLLVSRFDVKLVGTDSPLAKDAIEVRKRYPGSGSTRYGGTQLGGISIDEAYIYPSVVTPGPPAALQ